MRACWTEMAVSLMVRGQDLYAEIKACEVQCLRKREAAVDPEKVKIVSRASWSGDKSFGE